MDVLNNAWWGSGVLTAAHEGDTGMMERVLKRCESGAESSTRSPGDSMVRDGEDDEQCRRRRRRVAINYRNEDGLTAVHMATCAGHVRMIEFLVREGADPNAHTGYGRAPLHLSLEECNPAVLEALLKCGASTTVHNRNGRTPLALARRELSTTEDFCTNLRRSLEVETQVFEERIATLQKELGILERGKGGAGGEGFSSSAEASTVGFVIPRSIVGENSKKGTSDERTREQVVIEMEDLEAEHNELIQPLKEKLSTLEARQGRLEAAVGILQRWEHSANLAEGDVDDSVLVQEEEVSQEAAALDPELYVLFNQHAKSERMSLEHLEEIYHQQVADDFGLVKPDPLKDFHKALRWIGLSPTSKSTTIGIDEFSLIMLQLEQR